MEGKRRNLRRKIDHGEEDDVSQSSSNKNPKYSLSSLSFEVDKEVEETFRVKKSRESKLLKHKKVRQPPSLTPIHESPLMSDFDRTYSEQSLRELRQLQKFASSQIIGEQFPSQSQDVIVMNGDEFEEKIVEENSFLQQSANMIHKHELVQNEDDDSWENELAARGGIKLHVNNPHAANEVPRSRASSISSLKLFLNKNLTISKEQCSRHSRQIDLTEMTLSSLKDEKIVVNENLAQKTSSLLFFQEFRLYVSDVVGMLRVKEPYIDELHQAILHWIRQYNENEIIDTISEGFLRFQKASEVILQDVRSDICRLDTILETFQQFRLRNVQKYQTAFIDMSLPKIIGPFVVLDLVLCLFDFLTEGYPKFSIFDRPWVATLRQFSYSSENQDEMLRYVCLEIVLPFVSMSIDALVNPLSQRSSSILFAALKALMDFDPKDDQIQSLSNGIAHKFDQSMRTPLLNLDKLALIVENLKILSKFLFPHQIVSLVGKYFQYFYPQLLDTLDSEPSEPLEVQIRAYNKIVLLFQKLLTILELKPNSNENQNQSEHIFPNLYPTMKNLFLDVIDDSNDVKQKHSILLYRRSSLVRFLNQFSKNLE